VLITGSLLEEISKGNAAAFLSGSMRIPSAGNCSAADVVMVMK
jgi:hypothetical protein